MSSAIIRETCDKGQGILRLVPNFVPRRFNQAGRRLRLHPDDYYALGTQRGAIKERWFSSVIAAINGPLAPADEGMSYVSPTDQIEDKFLFKDAVAELGADLIGPELYNKYGTWPMYSKFFDYELPLFFHLHLTDEAAARVGRIGKPEAYYFPPQLNNHPGTFPVTYFGFDPTVSQEEVRQKLLDFEKSDTRITELSRAYRLQLGSGWYTPPGVLHAPGSYLTYEPQWNSDVNSVYENVTSGEVTPYSFLVENCPENKKFDVDYVLSLMDWEKNVDPAYRKNYFRPSIVCAHSDDKHLEKWIVYANPYFGGKELTVMPGQTVVVKDSAAYGCILLQGHGKFGVHDAEAAVMLRYGQLSADEYFVGEGAARHGVTITNHSRWEPMVMLKHFGPNHADMPKTVPNWGDMMELQNFELKNQKIRSAFLALKKDHPERLKTRLNLSWSNWGFGIESLADSAARLQKAGISFIELHGNHYGPDLGYKLDETLKILGDHGIKVGGVCGMFSADNDLSSNRAVHRQAALDYLRREIEFTAAAGGAYLLVVPGAVGRPAAYDDTEFERSVETLRMVADLFVKYNVRAAIEPIRSAEVSFVHTVADAKKYIAAVNHPGIRHINGDVYHMQAEEAHIGEALCDAGEALANLHMADSNRCALGLGALDLDTIIMALYLIGFNTAGRYVTPEPLGPGGDPYPAMNGKPDKKVLDDLVNQTATYFRQREQALLA